MPKSLASRLASIDESSIPEAALLAELLALDSRIRILLHLLDREPSGGELCEALGCSRGAIANPIALLKASGMVETRREGRKVRYSLSEKTRPMILASHEWALSRTSRNPDRLPTKDRP